LAASIEGIHRFKTDKRLARKLIAKYLRVTDETVLEQTHRLFSDLFERVPYIKREGLDSVAQLLGEHDSKIQAFKADSVVEDRFIRDLETSGFIRSLYQ